jgi:hypothetical protein
VADPDIDRAQRDSERLSLLECSTAEPVATLQPQYGDVRTRKGNSGLWAVADARRTTKAKQAVLDHVLP